MNTSLNFAQINRAIASSFIFQQMFLQVKIFATEWISIGSLYTIRCKRILKLCVVSASVSISFANTHDGCP